MVEIALIVALVIFGLIAEFMFTYRWIDLLIGTKKNYILLAFLGTLGFSLVTVILGCIVSYILNNL